MSASFPLTELYDPKTFITHAALLDQAFAHCPIFPTAASRRSLGRVSVPVWLIILSDQLPVLALVGHYPANKLMGRGLIFRCEASEEVPHFSHIPSGLWSHLVLARVSPGYPKPKGRLPTCSSPVRHSTSLPKETFAFDLHVLGTPPAFVLSQDQTLQLKTENVSHEC